MFSKNKAQGAIEYLLVLGAAIIVVAIVIILLTGVISNTNNIDEEVAFSAQKDLQYKNLGYSINVSTGETKEFLFDVVAEDTQLDSLFGDNPDANIYVNGNLAYNSKTGSWGNFTSSISYGLYDLKPTDKLKIDNPGEEINVKIKGNHAPKKDNYLSLGDTCNTNRECGEGSCGDGICRDFNMWDISSANLGKGSFLSKDIDRKYIVHKIIISGIIYLISNNESHYIFLNTQTSICNENFDIFIYVNGNYILIPENNEESDDPFLQDWSKTKICKFSIDDTVGKIIGEVDLSDLAEDGNWSTN